MEENNWNTFEYEMWQEKDAGRDLNVAENYLHPNLQQYAEFAQQMTATMYQNWWNSAPEQMKRAIEAGINPYLAANGITGSGNSSVASAPNSAVGKGSDVVSTAAHALSALTGVGSAAIAAYDTLTLNPAKKNDLVASAAAKLAKAGFDEAATAGIMIDNKYKDEDWINRLNIGRQQFENMKNDYQLVEQQRKYIEKEIERYDEQIQSTLDVNESIRLLNEKQKFLIEQNGIAQQLENEFTAKYWSHMDSPAGVALKNLWFKSQHEGNDEIFFKGYEALIDYYDDKSNTEFSNQFRENARWSWKSRPSNAFEMSAYIGTEVANQSPKLFNFIKSLNGKIADNSHFFNEIKKDDELFQEFNDSFDEAKAELYNDYRAARREYKEVSRSSAADSYKWELKRKMNAKKREYDEFTKEKYSQMLVEQLGTPK